MRNSAQHRTCCREEKPCHTLLPSCNKLLTCWGKRQVLLLRSWPKPRETTVFPPWSSVWWSKFPKSCHLSPLATTPNYTLHYYTFQIIPIANCSTKIQMLKSWVSVLSLSLSSQLDEMLQDIFPEVLNFVLGRGRQMSATLVLASRGLGTTENQHAKKNFLCKRSAGHCLLLPEPKKLPEKAKSHWQVVAARKHCWHCSTCENPALAQQECPISLGLV